MTICCFPNCAYLSETSRMISVFRRLEAKGENVVLATHGGTYKFILKNEEIPYINIEPFVSDKRSLEWAAISRLEKGLSGYYSAEELEEHVRSEIDFFKEYNVRAVLSGYTLSNAISSRVLGIPYAVTHLGSWVPPIFEANMSPWPVNYDNIVTGLIPTAVKTKLVNSALLRGRVFTKSFNFAAKKMNIPEYKNFLDLTAGDLTLVTDCPEILGIPAETMNNWVPKNPKLFNNELKMKYVGPIFAELFGEIPERVKTFYDTPLPKIYVALATSRLDYMEAVFSVLKDMDVKAIICTAVHHLENESHPNILIEKHLPSHKVMPLADLAIIHGGQGSVQTAISSGTPILGFPLHAEQDFNLRLVEKNGGGICLPLKNLKKKKFREHIEDLISDKSYKSNMQKMKDVQDRYDGPGNTAAALQDLAKESTIQ